MHRQFIPRSGGRLNSTQVRYKRHQNALYHVKPRETGIAMPPFTSKSNNMATQIENDIARQIQELEEFRHQVNQQDN